MIDLQLARLLGDTPGSACRHIPITGTVDALDSFVLCRCFRCGHEWREEYSVNAAHGFRLEHRREVQSVG